MRILLEGDNFFIMKDYSIFKIIHSENPDLRNYPVTLECVKAAVGSDWDIGEMEEWTLDGKYDIEVDPHQYNIIKEITKEENPEYFI